MATATEEEESPVQSSNMMMRVGQGIAAVGVIVVLLSPGLGMAGVTLPVSPIIPGLALAVIGGAVYVFGRSTLPSPEPDEATVAAKSSK